MDIGINQTVLCDQTTNIVDKCLDACVSLSASWLRTQFNWSWIEPERGKPRWEKADYLVEQAGKRRINLLGILIGSPPWATSQVGYPPTDLEAWAEFVVSVQKRYPSIVWWQVWNEQNISFWLPKPDWREYMNLLRFTRKLPERKLVLGGIAGIPGIHGDVKHFENCLQAGAADLVDAVAYHPYANLLPRNWWEWDAWQPRETLALKCLADVKALVKKYTGKSLEIWLTELGWATAGLWPWDIVSEQQQAEYWRRTRDAYNGKVDKLFYFDLWEMAFPGSFGSWWSVNHYGLFYNDFSPKPIAKAFR